MSRSISALVVMGVSGSGKSTLAALLSRRLGWPFRDADEFHPPENIAKMSAGHPLNDDDRAPWLAAIAAWVDAERKAGRNAIVTCSALKRTYREVLIGSRTDVGLIFLEGTHDVIHARMAARTDHFMPKSLLDSQLATLQPPSAKEGALRLDIEQTPEALADRAMAHFRLKPK
jgi:gluconokinase